MFGIVVGGPKRTEGSGSFQPRSAELIPAVGDMEEYYPVNIDLTVNLHTQEGEDSSATEGLRAWASVPTVAGSVVGRPTTLDDDRLRRRRLSGVRRSAAIERSSEAVVSGDRVVSSGDKVTISSGDSAAWVAIAVVVPGESDEEEEHVSCNDESEKESDTEETFVSGEKWMSKERCQGSNVILEKAVEDGEIPDVRAPEVSDDPFGFYPLLHTQNNKSKAPSPIVDDASAQSPSHPPGYTPPSSPCSSRR
ncbi:hypothetical protein L1887_20890 [Cichorium endivia]|nr:hypothetical protein L1887_20890 [Cichorium endivia]